jgi:MFS family permease
MGFGQLVFGALSDYYGRRIMLVGLLAFLCLSIGCVFVKNIDLLLALRFFLGFFVASTVGIAPAVVVRFLFLKFCL